MNDDERTSAKPSRYSHGAFQIEMMMMKQTDQIGDIFKAFHCNASNVPYSQFMEIEHSTEQHSTHTDTHNYSLYLYTFFSLWLRGHHSYLSTQAHTHTEKEREKERQREREGKKQQHMEEEN